MNPDGLSYLDLASDAVHGGPARLLNLYWSPAYPALIALALLLLRPSPALEFPIVHGVNFLVFTFAVWAFTVFLRQVFAVTAEHDDRRPSSHHNHLIPFSFCTLLYFTLRVIDSALVTPDLWVAALVFLAAAMTCRLALPGPNWRQYSALGLVLGGAFYVKAAMFPLGLLLLALLLVYPPAAHVPRRMLFLSLSVFVAVSLPLIIALSVRAHRLTFGETGKLNYIWYANGLHWTDGVDPPDPSWTPEHPAPKLLSKPLTYVFAFPVGGTYPLWYDPSYWYSSARPRFSLRHQIAALRVAASSCKSMAMETTAYVAGCVVLLGLLLRSGVRPARCRALWPMFGWPLGAFAMYSLVHVEGRFLGGFLVILWVALYASLCGRLSTEAMAGVCWTVAISIMLTFGAYVAWKSGQLIRGVVVPAEPEHVQVASALVRLGLRSGDGLAVVGYAYDCYYARYARMRVVAQIPDAQEFWRLSAAQVRCTAESLASVGVKAMVAFNRPNAAGGGGWTDVKISDSRQLSVLLLTPRLPSTTDDLPP